MNAFDLEKSIEIWKKAFRKSVTFDDGHLEEMEVHLRDHIEDLIADGSDEKSAFDVALKEFGDIPEHAQQESKNLRPDTPWYPYMFLRNHIMMAVRIFTKRPFITLLNTFGLAVGIAGALLIGLYIHDELSFDSMFADSDRIYRINIDNQTNGEYSEYASAPGPMAGVLVQDFPHAELVTRFREVGSTLIRHPDSTLNIKEEHVVGVDSAFFEMFGLNLREGNTQKALKNPNTAVLTSSVAYRLFGDNSAMGQSLTMDNKEIYLITGVMDDLPTNSFLRDHTVFLSLESFEDVHGVAWNTWYFPTFVKLHKESQVEDLHIFLNTVKDAYLIPWAMTFIPGLTVEKSRQMDEESGNFMRFSSTALTDIHLHSQNREGEFSQNGDIQNIYILGMIGCFLLLMAVVNFMNLSTANSLTRAKEVGIRKTLGSSRYGLLRQFLTEAVLTSFVALILALFLAMLVLPLFNGLAEKQISIPFYSPIFWLIATGSAFFLGLLSGSYPGLIMSRFAPVRALKNNNRAGGKGFRNSLVVFQFAISIFLIIGTLVVFQQVEFIRSKDLGFQKDQMLVIDNVDAAGNQLVSFKEEIKNLSFVDNVSLSSFLPTPSDRAGTTFFSEGSFSDGDFKTEQALIIENWDVDHEYIHTLNLQILAGRNFSTDGLMDANALIVNETTVSMLGIEPDEAIGLRLTDDFHRQDKENMKYHTIIGVVKNFHFETMRNRIDAVSFSLSDNANKMIIKLNAVDFTSAIEKVEDKWTQLAPGQPFHYYFMDESFNETYQADLRLGRIFVVFTQLSVFIACLGLFGLATFAAERRSKEIGIKKVLGAGIHQITMQLSFDFLKLVIISVFIALPLGWLVMNLWLNEFAFRIEISGLILATAALLALFVSLLTISYQSIKAAVANPVKSLRME